MKLVFSAALLCLTLAACSSAKDTPLPQDLSQLASIKPQVDKLTQEERELVADYVVRHALTSALQGGKDMGSGVPAGTTLGDAIEDQRKFAAEQKLEADRQAKLQAELEARRAAALKQMRDAVTVTLVSKTLRQERGYGGIVMDEHLVVTFGLKNNGTKDIAGVKGMLNVKDMFGDEVSGFNIVFDQGVAVGESATWGGSRSVQFSLTGDEDRKVAGLEDGKFTLEWKPKQIIFADGQTLEMPSES